LRFSFTPINRGLYIKKRYTDKWAFREIKEHEAGAKVDGHCRQFGISAGTFYN